MQLTSVLLLGALGVSAHPSGPAHGHRHLHQKKAVGDMVVAVIDGKTVSWENTYAGPTPAAGEGAQPAAAGSAAGADNLNEVLKNVKPTSTTDASPEPTVKAAKAVATKATTSTTSSNDKSSGLSVDVDVDVDIDINVGIGASTYTPFCGGATPLIKRATEANIMYTGNTGIAGDWGCNLQLVKSSAAKKYDYTILFKNAGAKASCACWNKIGADGRVNGMWSAAISWTLPAHGQQYVAVDRNSQGACACGGEDGTGDLAKNEVGGFCSSWVEFDMGSTINKGWSGADASVIVAQDSGQSFPGLKVCDAAGTTCSSISSSGVADNAYLAKDRNADGIGLNLNTKQVHLVATVNWEG